MSEAKDRIGKCMELTFQYVYVLWKRNAQARELIIIRNNLTYE